MKTTFLLMFFILGCAGQQPLTTHADASVAISEVNDAGVINAGTVESTDGGLVKVEPSPLRVLFVGNSYTEANDLPNVVRALGDNLIVESSLAGGAQFIDHWQGAARARIEKGGFDVLVLQGQSVEAITDVDNFIEYGFRLATAAQRVGARTVWFSTWARRAGDTLYDYLLPSYQVRTPYEMRQRIETRYSLLQKLAGGFVARVGVAWDATSSETFYAADGSHPSNEGTLLSACVLYYSITGNSTHVSKVPPLGISKERADEICNLALSNIACPYSSGTPTACSFECVYLDNDSKHCGACGRQCSSSQMCQEGMCKVKD